MNRGVGIIIAVAVFFADRASKFLILDILELDARPSIEIFPFFELTMVWNRGISLGLFQADSEIGRWVLVGLTAAVSSGLAVWLWRAKGPLLVPALALVVGGALGNLWDRIQYGAVADFFHFDFFFYVFNVADAAISVGVVLLFADTLLSPQKRNK